MRSTNAVPEIKILHFFAKQQVFQAFLKKFDFLWQIFKKEIRVKFETVSWYFIVENDYSGENHPKLSCLEKDID